MAHVPNSQGGRTSVTRTGFTYVVLAVVSLTVLLVSFAKIASYFAPPDKGSNSAPDVHIFPPVLNLGKVVEDVYPSHAVLKNDESVPIRISTVRASCSCTAVNYSHDWLKPGQSTKISCEWDLRNQAGQPTTTLEVIIEAPEFVADVPAGTTNLKGRLPAPPVRGTENFYSLPLVLQADVSSRWSMEPNPVIFNPDLNAIQVKDVQVSSQQNKVTVLDAESPHDAVTSNRRQRGCSGQSTHSNHV